MRLIHLTEYTPEHGGSYLPFLRSVLSEAISRGWKAEAVFPEAARGRTWMSMFEDEGIPVSFVSGSPISLTRQVRAMLADDQEPTILHAHFTTFDTPTALAVRRKEHAVLYWHIHTVLSDSPITIASNAIKMSLVARSVDRILCPSSNIADGLVKRFGRSERISVFPSPISLDLFPEPREEDRAARRAALGVPEGSRAVLMFGRDWLLKGGDILLEAMDELVGDGMNFFALLNQAGDEGRENVARLGLERNAAVVGPIPDVREMFGAADLFVAPSRGEGMPFAVIEALVSGMPVVASDLPGHRYLADELDACVIAPRTGPGLAAALREMVERDPALVRAQCAEARAWIGANLDLDVSTQRLFDDYEQTMRRVLPEGIRP